MGFRPASKLTFPLSSLRSTGEIHRDTRFHTPRAEEDKLEILSGIFEGRSTGAPIAFVIHNKDARPGDYDHLKSLYRPSHADFTYDRKFGHRDYRGGGRSSARATISVVAGGAMAKQLLKYPGVEIVAFVSQIGPVRIREEYMNPRLESIRSSPLSCPDPDATKEMITYLDDVKSSGDTAGGVISCIIKDSPAGLGEPVFDKLQADLAKAMFSINAVKGFEYGSGFRAAFMRGSAHNDPFVKEGEKIVTMTNHSGGIQGGISNGMDIIFQRCVQARFHTRALSKQLLIGRENRRSFRERVVMMFVWSHGLSRSSKR